MSRLPEYDRSTWDLDSHEGDYALLILKKDTSHACIVRCVDGDWERNDEGAVEDMRRKFMRVALPLRAQQGIGHDEFDKAYPHTEWEQIDWFDNSVGINYSLWKHRSRSPNPLAVSFNHWQDDLDGPVLWRVIEEGALWDIKESFAKAKAALASKEELVPPEPDPILSHPNFGRF